MLLSEALRLGSMATKQISNVRQETHGREIYTCALGAIGFAVGRMAEEAFPVLEKLFFHPVLGNETLHRIIATLNNGPTQNVYTKLPPDRQYTREEIADWIQTLERDNPAAFESTVGLTKAQEEKLGTLMLRTSRMADAVAV